MRKLAKAAVATCVSWIAACSSDGPVVCCARPAPTLRVVNAYTGPVDVLIDGSIVIGGLPAGAVDSAGVNAGARTLQLRPTGTGASVSRGITIAYGALQTIAAVRSSTGSVESAVLDDTNSVVPEGATKVRVLHMAPNAGTLQVFRTQPDWQQPVSWQFPFDYQPEPTSLSAPFYQSTVGTWEIRIWQTPADSSGWSTAPVRVTIPLQSGHKATVLILDKDGGGVRAEVL